MTLIVRSQTPGPMRHETVRKLTNPLEEMQARYSPVAAETPKWQQKSPIDGRGFQNTALDRSDVQFCDARLHICCRFVQRGLFIGGELDLDDFFHPVLPDLDRNAAIDVLQSVLALKPFSTMKRNVRNRAEPRTPARSNTRCRGEPLTFFATYVIMSSGFETTIMMAC